ncbi:MAG: AIR carboxylase family protein [Candidatus Bathyarchaeota archaeon]|nr:MAG: AIR carboxylase family protein [Candidatus Bathyarchaeota archaeon]
MSKQKVIILMGSRKDFGFVAPIGRMLEHFCVHYEYRIASAHKTPKNLLSILEEHEQTGNRIVYITVAGLSNALSGLVDANTRFPVISCPPYSEKFGGTDIYSTLRMPSGVAPLAILNPESAALSAVKILALQDPSLFEKIREFQLKKKKEVNVADSEVKGKRISELEGE